MAGAPNEPIQKVLRSMQGEGALADVHGEPTAIRGYLYAVHRRVGNICARPGRHEARRERLEQRLELRGAEPA